MIKRIYSFLLIFIFLLFLTGCHKHNYIQTVVEPTCTEQGYIKYTCECEDTYNDNYVDALGHTFVDGEIVNEPTEYEEGSQVIICERCGEEDLKTLDKLPHTHKYKKSVIKPTCTEQGYTLYTCECEDSYKENYTNMIPHQYGEYVITKQPTEEEEGMQEKICQVCNHKVTEVVPVLQRQEVNVTLDLNGGKLKEEYTLENAPIAQKITITQYMAYDANGYQVSMHQSHSAIYWYYIVLCESAVQGYYEIKEIVYQNSQITVDYDYVVMWHSSLKDENASKSLMSMYINASIYSGRLVKFENVPSDKGTCEITMNVLGIGSYSNIINDIYKEQREFPVVERKDCKFLGWECSLDNELYSSFPGYFENPGNITYTAKWELNEISNLERIEGTFSDISSYFEKLGSIYENIELITKDELRNTTIVYESNNKEVLSNSGEFKKPYVDTKVTYKVTIGYQNETKEYTFEFDIEGYKKLENIASSYVYTNYNSLTNEFFDTMDIIYCAFVLIDVDGGFTGLNGSGQSIHSTNKTYLNYMKNIVIPQAHKRGGWVVASLGGGGSAYDLAYEQICNDDKKLDNFVKNVINLINEYGFDGIDIDWEIPDDGKKFTKLMEKLYPAVKANNKNHLVTAAIGGGMWQPPKYDLKNSKQYLDYINLMTYSMVSNGGYHHTSLYKSSSYFDSENKVGHTLVSCSVDESLKIYKDSFDINPDQLIIGGAFYGAKQTRSKTSTGYTDWKSSGSISYTNIKKSYMNNDDYECFYDTNCQAAYILSKDKLTFISYDNIQSMKAKCEYVLKTGAAGIMYWQNGQDTTGDLVNAIKEGLNK